MLSKNHLQFLPKSPQFKLKSANELKSKIYETIHQKKKQFEAISEEFVNIEIPFFGSVGSVGNIFPPPEGNEEKKHVDDFRPTAIIDIPINNRNRCNPRIQYICGIINIYPLCVLLILIIFFIVAVAFLGYN